MGVVSEFSLLRFIRVIKWRKKQYKNPHHTAGTVPNCNRKIKEKEKKNRLPVPIARKCMPAHFPGIVQALQ